MLDDPIEDIVGGNRQDARADLLQGELNGISAGDAGAGHDGDHRLKGSLAQLEGERDSVGFEHDAWFVDFRRKLVGEMSHEVLGQPGIHLFIAENRLPAWLVANVVAKLEAAGDEPLGSAGPMYPR
jgi:hypothetical protein